MPVIQVTMSQGRTVEQWRELVSSLTREAGRIPKTREQPIHVLIYEVEKRTGATPTSSGLTLCSQPRAASRMALACL